MRIALHVLLGTALLALGVGVPLRFSIEGQSLFAEPGFAEAKGGNGKGGGDARGNGGDTGGGKNGTKSDSKAKDKKGGSSDTAGDIQSGAFSGPAAAPYYPLRSYPPKTKPGRVRTFTSAAPRAPARRTEAAAARGAWASMRGAPGTSAKNRVEPASIPRSAGQPKPAGIVVAGLTDPEIEQVSAKGLTAARTTTLARSKVVKLRLPRGMTTEAARRAVAEVNAQAVSDADAYYYTDGAPTEPAGGLRAETQIQWTGNMCGGPPVIGMIDTRIDTAHEALAGQDIEVIELGATPAASRADHGTAIAALLSGKPGSDAPGLLPRAKLVAVDAFADEMGIERADVVRIVDALEALSQRGIRIVNLSFSGPPNAVLKQAIDKALAGGMILVAAAGNGGPGGEPAYPAAYPGVIAVTALDREMRIYPRATRGDYVALAAPGVGIRTAAAGGGDDSQSGTSFAVPYVTAAVANLLSRDPALDGAAVSHFLTAAARDLGQPGRDPVYGWGLLQTAGLCDWPRGTPIPPIAGEMILRGSSVANSRKGRE